MKEELGCLIGFTINAGTGPAEKRRFFRDLYGWRDKSQYGKYEYDRKGLLSDVPHIRLTRGVFIVAQENKLKVKRFLKEKAAVITRQVILNEKDKRILAKNEDEE